MATAGPNFVGSATDDTSVGTIFWSNVSRVKAADVSYATAVGDVVTTTTSRIKATQLNFSFPTGTTVTGVEVNIKRATDTSPTVNVTCKDLEVRLLLAGVVSGNNKADTSTAYTTTLTNITYGGPGDLWGLTPTLADVVNTGFGVSFRTTLFTDNATAAAVLVDSISMTLYVTLPSPSTLPKNLLLNGVGP